MGLWSTRRSLAIAVLSLVVLLNAQPASAAQWGGHDKTLRIAVPRKTGFKAFVDVTDSDMKGPNFTGYSIDVFNAAMAKLLHQPKYEFHVFDGSYDKLVRSVASGEFSAAVGDVTITAERAVLVDFTMPYTPSGVSLLVREEDDSKPIEWIFVKPLTRNLWLATVGFFFFTGFVVWMIERPGNPEYQGSSLRQMSTASYFALSTLTFTHGQIIKSPLSKIVVVIWCFVVLILVQSYTASLSSMLTAKRLRPSVTSLDQLLFNGDYVGYQNGSFVHSILRNRGFSENRLRFYGTKEEYAEALKKGSMNKGVSAIVDEIPYLTSFLSDPQYQKEFQIVNRIYKTPGFGFVFPLNSPLVHNLSTAILRLTGEPEGSQIEEKWFGTAAQSTGDASPRDDSMPLTFKSFSGLFVISGCISSLMLLISTARLVRTSCIKETRVDPQGGEDQALPDGNQPADDIRIDVLEVAQRIDQGDDDDDDGGPRPMQNGMLNGPTTVQHHDHVHMDMNTG